MSYYELSPEQQILEDEKFWAEMDAEFEAEQLWERNYINSLSEEEYYRQYVLPNVPPVQDEDLREPSIEVI